MSVMSGGTRAAQEPPYRRPGDYCAVYRLRAGEQLLSDLGVPEADGSPALGADADRSFLLARHEAIHAVHR